MEVIVYATSYHLSGQQRLGPAEVHGHRVHRHTILGGEEAGRPVVVERSGSPARGDTAALIHSGIEGVDQEEDRLAVEVLYFGDNISATDAERMGIVNKIVPDSDFPQATAELALRLTKVSPIAAKFTKHAVYLGLETDLLKTLEYVTYARTVMERTPDAGEGVKATLEKREPEYKGRV